MAKAKAAPRNLLDSAWGSAKRLAVRALFPELPRHDASLGQVGIQVAGPEMRWAAAVRQRGGRFRVTHCDFKPLPRPSDPASSVQQLLTEAALAKAQCNYVLDAGEYQLLLVDAPDVPDSELREALRWRIREMIDFSLDEAVIDAFDMPRAAASGSGHMMCVVVCRNQLVTQKVAMFSRESERLEVIDVAELALRNLMSLLEEDRNGVALLHLQAQSGLLLISRSSTMHLCRRIRSGYEDLVRQRREESPGELAVAAEPQPTASTAFEVVRSLEFYEQQFKAPSVAALYVAPGPSPEITADLCAALGEAAGLPVKMLNLEPLVDSDVPLTPERQARCLFVLGAALREEATTL